MVFSTNDVTNVQTVGQKKPSQTTNRLTVSLQDGYDTRVQTLFRADDDEDKTDE
jgi:hypothetical protein